MADVPSGVRPTRVRTLLVSGLIGAGIAVITMAAATSYELTVPTVPWSTPILLFVAAVAVTVLARVTHLRNHVVRQPQDPMRAIVTLAIAKAMLIGGSLLSGGYLAFALFSVGHLDAPLPKQRLVIGLVSTVASVAVLVAGLALERACRTPDDEDEKPDT